MLPNSDLRSSEASRHANREIDQTASGASGGTFRKFRHVLMAKQLESRGDTHLVVCILWLRSLLSNEWHEG